MTTKGKLATAISGLKPEQLKAWLGSMTPAEAQALLDDWDLWAMPHQRLPGGDWKRWVLRAGRGAGKSFAASKTVNEVARDKHKIGNGEIAIIAVNYRNALACVEDGDYGILATARSDFRPEWELSKQRLTWPNGVVGRIFSADKPASLRGKNWAWVWADEVCFWPHAKQTWSEVIQPAIRKGWARAMLTTTPKPDGFLTWLEARSGTVVTRASTYDNRFLSSSVLQDFREMYEGTRAGLQELEGVILDGSASALFSLDNISSHRINEDDFDISILRKIVVAIDPATTSGEDSDETGIIVAGIDDAQHIYILEDLSLRGKPHEWAKVAVNAYRNWGANYIVAETNQGGAMVESTLRTVDANLAYRKVHAKKSKSLRAEPVATAYERGKVSHVGFFSALELQQCEWEPGKPSPDHLDALVYAVLELMEGGTVSTGLSALQAYGVVKGNNRLVRRR